MKIPFLISSGFYSKGRKLQRITIWIVFGTIILSSACNPGLDTGEDWAYPFPLKESNNCYKVATPFSVENPWDHAHEAVDFACLADTPILAVHTGVIEQITFTEVMGEKRVRISLALSDFLVRVEYLNLRQVGVQEGQRVDRGTQLGLSATGLHVAVWNRVQDLYVDPAEYLILPVPEEILE